MVHALLPAGANIVFRHGNDVLLIRRSSSVRTWPNFWAFPGGKVDNDEFFRETAIRETEEEIGVAVNPNHIRQDTVIMTRTAQGTKVVYFAEVHDWTGQPTICETKNISDMAWFPLSQLPEMMIPHHREALYALKQGESYREFDVAP